ncbi:MAG: hypothetical protein J6R04_06430 [Clostridia bacterium]|nr:hypothetical protein [Clostridia bacterium]
MDKDFLNNFDIDDTLKAFTVSLCRMIVEEPRLLLAVDEIKGTSEWKELFERLQGENELQRFSENVHIAAKEYNWQAIEETYRNWGEYGWITDHSMVPFGFWENCPSSQMDADKSVIRALDKAKISELKAELSKISNDYRLYNEAITCFDNKCYAACASLLISLIDGELIRCKSTAASANKKTGIKAGERIVDGILKTDRYGLPGLFHLELLNYQTYIKVLFKKADGFENEPKHLNRNYLHHGMSKRKVLRKDCIKLLIAYRKTINFTKHF